MLTRYISYGIYDVYMGKVLINFPDEFLKDIDRYCRDWKYERTELVRLAVREKIYPRDIPATEERKPTPVSQRDTQYTCQARNFNPRVFCREKATKFFKTNAYQGNEQVSLSGWLCNNHYEDISEANWDES